MHNIITIVQSLHSDGPRLLSVVCLRGYLYTFMHSYEHIPIDDKPAHKYPFGIFMTAVGLR